MSKSHNLDTIEEKVEYEADIIDTAVNNILDLVGQVDDPKTVGVNQIDIGDQVEIIIPGFVEKAGGGAAGSSLTVRTRDGRLFYVPFNHNNDNSIRLIRKQPTAKDLLIEDLKRMGIPEVDFAGIIETLEDLGWTWEKKS